MDAPTSEPQCDLSNAFLHEERIVLTGKSFGSRFVIQVRCADRGGLYKLDAMCATHDIVKQIVAALKDKITADVETCVLEGVYETKIDNNHYILADEFKRITI